MDIVDELKLKSQIDKDIAVSLNLDYPSTINQRCLDEITKLRQEVSYLKAGIAEDLEQTIKDLREQLALRDLEVARLRGDLRIAVSELEAQGCSTEDKDTYEYINYAHCKKSLSTSVTTAHLQEWYKGMIGEPVAWMSNSDITCVVSAEAKLVRYHNSDFNIPLYAAVKEFKHD